MDRHLLLWQQTPAGPRLVRFGCAAAAHSELPPGPARFSVRAVSRGLSNNPAQSSGLIRDAMHQWHRIGVNMTTDLHGNVRGFHTGENRLSRLAYLHFRLNACSLGDRLGG
ncbi:hypothetical protein CesoFtcFv8_008305 [Champsocephalus esox]|nr:hypothetical protein CesoFtcFv8_008304 [Champsocephalus esox]KAK5898759.1 hypothetical protein CesoFtcFv8_008305 [Champsocephalus esox]